MEVNSSTDMSSLFSPIFPRSRQTCQQWLARSFSGHGLLKPLLLWGPDPGRGVATRP